MKSIRSMFTLLALTAAFSSHAQTFTVAIDQIVANDSIVGHVNGLEPEDVANYKIIVYVHTDQWYIHPYAGQGEGKTWAAVRNDGTWRISTVRREFQANRVAALLVPRSLPEPNKTHSLATIPYSAIIDKDIVGTADYGKL